MIWLDLGIKEQRRTTVCRRVFELWCFTVIIVTVIQYFAENYYLKTIPLQYRKIYAYVEIFYVLVILTISLITDTYETLLKCKEPVKCYRASKIKRAKAKIIYYNNSIATFNIILSGDIEQNPGPGLPKPKCPRCDKTVRCNQKRLICQLCLDAFHANCVNLKHHVRNSIDAKSWTVYFMFHPSKIMMTPSTKHQHSM